MNMQITNRLDVVDSYGVCLFHVEGWTHGVRVVAAAPYTMLNAREAAALAQAVEYCRQEVQKWQREH